MNHYEKLGVFYLGKEVDQETKKTTENLVLYDSKDLVTHAICVGMTGSGKTGLCIDLLEEAAMDGIPSLIIDPKGDMPNLMLTFPSLEANDFIPWVNEEEARKKNLTREDYAREQAELWKKGLTAWGIEGSRIHKLRESVDMTIYTPGSNAGHPVSILSSFDAPPPLVLEDSEALADQINTTVTSLLSLLGIEADPIKSREHILLSTLLNHSWSKQINLDLTSLIQQIQIPPLTRIGALDWESFFPKEDRFRLAMSINNLLAAPGFQTWMEGPPLHINSLLYTKEGKPRISIFSIAHLNEAERMFFVTLLLNQIVGWTRTQSGTTSLRAILYMDEIVGYFPPVANPPSKQPLLTLLKQARAYGLGVVLVTQNPVDLDYKGLSNTGTWLIGRLQTQRDQARVLDGLEGAMASSSLTFNRKELEQTMAGLGSRRFILNNVHEDYPFVFESRWAMSYLRGPLTRNQIKELSDPTKELKKSFTRQENEVSLPSKPPQPFTVSDSSRESERPILSPGIDQYFVPTRSNNPTQMLLYQPKLLGVGKVYFNEKKASVDVFSEYVYQIPIQNGPLPVRWEEAKITPIIVRDLQNLPIEGAIFSSLPGAAREEKNYASWNKEFVTYLYQNTELTLFSSTSQKMLSQPNESERDFRVRLLQTSREERDLALEKLREKYAPKILAIKEQIRKSQQAVERETEQAKQQKMQTAIHLGATLLGALTGRKTISASTIGRATTSIKNAGRAGKEIKDIDRAKETVQAMMEKLEQVEVDFKEDTEKISRQIDPQTEPLKTVVVKPVKSDITVSLFTLCWFPYWLSSEGVLTPAF